MQKYFDNLPNSLDDLDEALNAPAAAAKALPKGYEAPTHLETCPKCRGTGRFIGYTGRDFGPCFTCKGAGKKSFKTSKATREQSRAKAAEKRSEKASDLIASAVAWQEAHPAAHKWISDNYGRNAFATSLLDSLTKYGSLTDNQLAAVERNIAKRAEKATEREKSAVAIDMSKIEAAFATARQNAKELGAMGIRWLTLRLDTFKFLDAPAKGQWSAAVLVREGDAKLGRIQNGKFVRSFACDDPTEARIVAAAADPAAAAVAYGLKYSSCSICGRELTDPESIKRGIGPICAEKFGW